MNTQEIIKSFEQFKEVKNIDKATLMAVLEEVLLSMLIKKYGTDQKLNIVINPERGDLQIWRTRLVVADAELTDEGVQIRLTEAKKIDSDFEIGEEVSEEVHFSDFGRRNILSIRQQLMTKIQELDREHIYKKYKERLNEIILAEVYQIFKKELIVLDEDGNELILPKSEMINKDFYKKGDTLCALVFRVESIGGNPRITLSRTAPAFLEKLLERDVPEVFDGLITIKKVVREPGERAKVVVESYDDRIDPVGACVGVKGNRIHGVVRELRQENIDVINHTSNTQLLIQRALSPAKINHVTLAEDHKKASVYLDSDQVALAIGKGGVNIKLASKLCGVELEIYREDVNLEDIHLDEFSSDIDPWIIETLKKIGCDTARSVLDLSVSELVRRTDLEEETVLEIIKILKAEFE